ncbi:GTP 3',8-cyclase MoaA [Atopobiaceae bacterium 24-176]
MIDETGRSITYLRLSVTDRCNCRCRYCMPAQGVDKVCHGDVMSFEEMAEVVAACARLGVKKVRITGGEPLARLGVERLVAMVRKVDGIEEIAMTTNATLLAPRARALAAAGLDRVNVSLDSLDPARYRSITRIGCLEDALAGLEAAREAGLGPVKVNAVLLGGVNEADIRPLAGLAKDGAAASVRFIELMPIGEAAQWPASSFVPAERVLEELPELVPVGADGVSETYTAPGWLGTVGLIRPLSHRFCSGCNRIRVTADGMLKACLHSSREVPLRGLGPEELVRTVVAEIGRKPEGHTMDALHASQSARPMNAIGG